MMLTSTYFTLLVALLSVADTTAAPQKKHHKKRQCAAGGGASKPSVSASSSTGALPSNINLAVSASGRGGYYGTNRTRTRTRSSTSTSTSAVVIVQPGPSTSPTTDESNPAPINSSSAVAPSTSPAPMITSSAVASPSASPAPPVSSAAGGGTVAPRGDGSGLGWNGDSGTKIASFMGDGSDLSWYYGWSLDALPNMNGLEFIPQVHGLAAVPNVKAASAKWTGVKYVLGFNEPDMGGDVGGSAIPAEKAASSHQEWVTALGGSYSIVSPAVARGSKQWMKDWVEYCGGKCKYDYVGFHFYGTNADDLISYAKDFYTEFGKPLWLTEWSCKDYSSGYTCNAAEVEDFMSTAIDWFRGDGKEIVVRWAYFGAWASMANAEKNPNGLQATDGSANDMGKYYVSL